VQEGTPARNAARLLQQVHLLYARPVLPAAAARINACIVVRQRLWTVPSCQQRTEFWQQRSAGGFRCQPRRAQISPQTNESHLPLASEALRTPDLCCRVAVVK
jgi:hypothetical protein